MILGSVGIVLAFLGTVLTAYAAAHTHSSISQVLAWTSLVEVGHRLDPGRHPPRLVLLSWASAPKLASPRCMRGSPMPHPSPRTRLRADVGSVALRRVLRRAPRQSHRRARPRIPISPALLPRRRAPVPRGRSPLIIGQRDYKRLLAYSSMEHMGIIALAAAVGPPLAMSAAPPPHARSRPRQSVASSRRHRSHRWHHSIEESTTSRPRRPSPAPRRTVRPCHRSPCSASHPFALFATNSGSPAPAPSARASAGRSRSLRLAAGRLRRHRHPRRTDAARAHRPDRDRPGTQQRARRSPRTAAARAFAVAALGIRTWAT